MTGLGNQLIAITTVTPILEQGAWSCMNVGAEGGEGISQREYYSDLPLPNKINKIDSPLYS